MVQGGQEASYNFVSRCLETGVHRALYTPPRIPGWTARNPGGIPGIHVDFWVFKGLLIPSNESTKSGHSIWNPCGIWPFCPHGLSLTLTHIFHMDSTWIPGGLKNPHGFHMDSTWSPGGLKNPHGFHMDSTWSPGGLKNFIYLINNSSNSNF